MSNLDWAEESEKEELERQKEKEKQSEPKKEEPKTKSEKKSIFDENLDLKKIMEDKESPLYSEVNSFEDFKNLKQDILKGLQAKSFNKPSSIQAKTLPIILDTKKNLIAQSQSGTGKTLCFGVAMLSAVDPSKNVPQAICLCPSLELGQQNYNFIKEISQYTKVNVEGYLKGDMSEDKITAQVIIGTPGKIVGLIKGKKLMTNDIKLFVLDEADQMIDQTQGELRVQVDFVKKMIPKQSRVMLFSATYQETLEGTDHGSKKDQKIMEYAEKFVPEEKEKILIPRTELALTAIRQYAVICQDDKDKFNVLSTIFRELPIAQAMIFLHTKVGAQELAKQLRDKGFTISLLHSDISSEERKDIIKAFEKGDTKLLISTNVLARGIDVKQVTHVINYDPPYTKDNGPDPDLYLHRIGRTGRFGRQGYAINLCSEKDRNIYDYIAKYFKKDMTWLKSSDDLEYTIK